MTPEQRADQLVKRFWEKNAWDKNFDQSDLARELIAGAIREAITEEREAYISAIKQEAKSWTGGAALDAFAVSMTVIRARCDP